MPYDPALDAYLEQKIRRYKTMEIIVVYGILTTIALGAICIGIAMLCMLYK